MTVVVSSRAEKQIKKLPKMDQYAVMKKIVALGEVEISDVKKLAGIKDAYRIRVGSYRIVYILRGGTYYVELVRHRNDVYEKLKELLG